MFNRGRNSHHSLSSRARVSRTCERIGHRVHMIATTNMDPKSQNTFVPPTIKHQSCVQLLGLGPPLLHPPGPATKYRRICPWRGRPSLTPSCSAPGVRATPFQTRRSRTPRARMRGRAGPCWSQSPFGPCSTPFCRGDHAVARPSSCRGRRSPSPPPSARRPAQIREGRA